MLATPGFSLRHFASACRWTLDFPVIAGYFWLVVYCGAQTRDKWAALCVPCRQSPVSRSAWRCWCRQALIVNASTSTDWSAPPPAPASAAASAQHSPATTSRPVRGRRRRRSTANRLITVISGRRTRSAPPPPPLRVAEDWRRVAYGHLLALRACPTCATRRWTRRPSRQPAPDVRSTATTADVDRWRAHWAASKDIEVTASALPATASALLATGSHGVSASSDPVTTDESSTSCAEDSSDGQVFDVIREESIRRPSGRAVVQRADDGDTQRATSEATTQTTAGSSPVNNSGVNIIIDNKETSTDVAMLSTESSAAALSATSAAGMHLQQTDSGVPDCQQSGSETFLLAITWRAAFTERLEPTCAWLDFGSSVPSVQEELGCFSDDKNSPERKETARDTDSFGSVDCCCGICRPLAATWSCLLDGANWSAKLIPYTRNITDWMITLYDTRC